MTTRSRLLAAGSIAALIAAIPVATASAHPGVYTVTAKVAPRGVVYPNAAGLTDQTQYAIANDGYTLGLREDNGVTDHGMVNYKELPGTYRANMTALQKIEDPTAASGAQPHATCDVAALTDPQMILAWQVRPDNDPFYDYVPWQKTSAGLGDEPEAWIPVVQRATGVNLSTLDTADQFRSACSGIGGTYHPADTPSNIATAQIADAVAPVQSQVDLLSGQVGTLQRTIDALTGAKNAADQAAAAAQAGKTAAEAAAARSAADLRALAGRPLSLTLAAKRFGPPAAAAMVTGTAGRTATVTVTVTKPLARSLGLRSNVLARERRSLGGAGAALLTPAPGKAVAKALAQHRGAVRVTVTATLHGASRSVAATVTH